MLDTVFLKGDLIDKEILSEEAFGEVHYACLQQSRFSTHWTKRVLENFLLVRRFQEVHRESRFIVLQNAATKQKIVVFTGRWFQIPETKLDSETFLIRQELNVDLSDHAEVEKRLRQEVCKDGFAQLVTLLDGIGVLDRLFNRDDTKDGRLEKDSNPTIVLQRMDQLHRILWIARRSSDS